MDLPQSLQQAMALLNAGRLPEAEQLCLAMLATAPTAFQARHLLGLVRLRQGRPADALAALEAALAAAPGSPVMLTSRGLALQALGRWQEALNSYERALAAKPDHVAALYNRGIALRQLKRPQDSLASYARVLALDPRHAGALNNRGNILRDLGQPQEALASFDAALALKPGDASMLANRGIALNELRRFEEALAAFDDIVARDPGHVGALYHRGNILRELKRPEEALASYERTLALKPDHAEALYARANTLLDVGRVEESLPAYDRALALLPDHIQTLNNRGVALLRLRREIEALESFDRILALEPGNIDALTNRGNALKDLKRFGEALASFEAALAADPGFVDALNNHGITLWELNRPEEALVSLDAALARDPDHPEVLHNRGNALNTLNRLEEAAASFEAALALRPGHRFAFGSLAGAALSLCDWQRTTRLGAEIERYIATNSMVVPPMTLLGYSGAPALLLKAAMAATAEKAVTTAPLHRPAQRRDKIRVGYLSADFRTHPVAFQIAALIEQHDRARFDCVGLSLCEDDGSAIRARLALAFGGLHDLTTISDRDAALRIRDMGIDILVDLTGHTLGARHATLCHRPAPVQVNYLGYPGTLGGGFIDYMLADRIVAPFAQQAHFTERLVHLPDTFFPTERRPIAEQTPSRREAGLPDDGFVFCCFNNNWKITPPLFDIWMRLLGAVPGSVLWLQPNYPGARENLTAAAAARGVDPARLVFAQRVEAMDEHLARLRLADLFLDTLPYNAHATACDALWAGLPVLTCLGQSFAGRVAGSLLHAGGLPELVTETLADYEKLALALARDAGRLRAIRQKLADNRLTCPLFDTERLCRAIEAAYERMHEIAIAGGSPQAFAVSPDLVTNR